MDGVRDGQPGIVPDYAREAVAVARPRGGIVIGGRYSADTLQCVHCGAHWQVVSSDRTPRGFCVSCQGPTCGHAACDPCLPADRRLDAMEAGLSLHEALRRQESRRRPL